MDILLSTKSPFEMTTSEEENNIALFFLICLLQESKSKKLIINKLVSDSLHGFGIRFDTLKLSPNKECVIELIEPLV